MMQKMPKAMRLRDLAGRFFWADTLSRIFFGKLAKSLDHCASRAPPQALYPAFEATRPPVGAEPPGCNHRFFDLLDAGPALLIATDRANIGPCEEWLNSVGIGVVHRRCFDSVARMMRHKAPQISLLLIDIDSLGGIAATIDDVIRLRDAQPGIPLILLSAEIHGSDFSTERLRLCDVTLRAPVSHSALELAIVEAACNNLIWCGREDD